MWLKQSTAFTEIVGPILDSTGAEYTGAVIGDLSISKNGTEAAMASAATLTHVSNGWYTLVGTTGNSDTLGRVTIRCNKSTYQMPPHHFVVLTATVFNALVTNEATAAGGLCDVQRINGIAASSVTTINANIGMTQPVNFTGTAGSALVKADTIDIAGTPQTARDLGAITANTITHLNTIFDTDYATIYDTTNKAFLSKLGNFAMGGSSLALTTGAISCSTITASGAVAFQSTFTVTTSTALGALSCSTLTASGAVALQSTVTVSGATSLAALSTSGTTTLNALTVTNATTLTGAVSLGSTLGITGTTTFAAINASTLATSGTATFNALTVTNALLVSGATTFTGAVTGTNASNDLRINGKVPGATDGLFIAGTNAATTITTGLTTHFIGTIDTVTTYTGNTPQTGDAYAQTNSGTFGLAAIKGYVDDIGVAGAGLTALGDTRLGNLDATVSSRLASASYTVAPTAAQNRAEMDSNSVGLAAIYGRTDVATSTRMATYTQPTGFLAANFTTGIPVSDKTGFSLTSAYDAAKTASSQASVTAITTLLGTSGNAATIGGAIDVAISEANAAHNIVADGTSGNPAIYAAIGSMQTHGDSTWATATGFSTFDSASDPVTLDQTQPAVTFDSITLSNGLVVTQGNANAAAVSLSGNGTGPGLDVYGGQYSDGIRSRSGGTAGYGICTAGQQGGMRAWGEASGAPGITLQGFDAAGAYFHGVGNGNGIDIRSENVFGVMVWSQNNCFDVYSTAGNAVYLQSAATDAVVVYPGTNSSGLHIWGGTTTGDAVKLDTYGDGSVYVPALTSVGDVVLAASQPHYAPAVAGDQMDWIDAPNATAIAAIQDGLTPPDVNVTVSPSTNTVPDRVIGAEITCYSGEAGWTIGPITQLDGDGEPIPLNGLDTLHFIVEDQYGVDVLDTTSVTITGADHNQWSVTGTAGMTATAPAKLKWSLREKRDGPPLVNILKGHGTVNVVRAADVDPEVP